MTIAFTDYGLAKCYPACRTIQQVRSLILPVALAGLLFAIPASSQVIEINADHLGGIMHARAGRPAFALAVIRQSAPGAEFRFGGIGVHPDSFEATGNTLRELITFAYAVPDDKELVGGPSWLSKQRFDIRAKIEDADLAALKGLPLSKLKDEMRVRLQVLLEQRFKLQLGVTKKDLPIMALELAKGGSKCKKVVENDSAAFEHLPPPPPPADSHRLSQPSDQAEIDALHWKSNGLPFPLIVSWISQQEEIGGRTVVDRTGLAGGFDCELSWTRERNDPADSTFLRAMREQLGLRLQPTRGPLEVLVVQNIEPPSAN